MYFYSLCRSFELAQIADRQLSYDSSKFATPIYKVLKRVQKLFKKAKDLPRDFLIDFFPLLYGDKNSFFN